MDMYSPMLGFLTTILFFVKFVDSHCGNGKGRIGQIFDKIGKNKKIAAANLEGDYGISESFTITGGLDLECFAKCDCDADCVSVPITDRECKGYGSYEDGNMADILEEEPGTYVYVKGKKSRCHYSFQILIDICTLSFGTQTSPDHVLSPPPPSKVLHVIENFLYSKYSTLLGFSPRENYRRGRRGE